MIIRSILFYVLLGMWTIFMGIICLPYLFIPFGFLRKPICFWIKGAFFLIKVTCGITYEVRGAKNIPKKAVIVVSKHQSTFETFVLFYHINNSIFIHKKQLFFIPIFGQYLKKINMIPIDRKGGASTMKIMLQQTKEKLKNGFSIIIFPEGTRKKPGDIPKYKSGFTGIYKESKTDILPVAVNSGNCWPKQMFIKKQGHIIIEFMNVIPSGLDRQAIFEKVQNIIEKKTEEIN